MSGMKVALITGAGSGMGQVAARRLLARGVKVVGLDLNGPGLEATRGGRPNFLPVVCDVTDEEAVERVVAETWRDQGPIDRLLHCAALMPSCVLIDHDPRGVKKLMRVNYDGTVNVAYSVLKRMNERGRGQAFFFGSVAGWVLSPHFGAYCASKAAVNAFVEMLIRENKHREVHIMLIAPPQVNTPLLEQTTSKPNTLELAKQQGMLRSPDFIVDQIEAGAEKGTQYLLPGLETKVLAATRRFAPNLLWNVIQRAEDGKPLFTW